MDGSIKRKENPQQARTGCSGILDETKDTSDTSVSRIEWGRLKDRIGTPEGVHSWHFFFYILFILCVWRRVRTCHSTYSEVREQPMVINSLLPLCGFQKSVLSFHHVGSRAGTQDLKLASKHFYPLNPLIRPVLSYSIQHLSGSSQALLASKRPEKQPN